MTFTFAINIEWISKWRRVMYVDGVSKTKSSTPHVKSHIARRNISSCLLSQNLSRASILKYQNCCSQTIWNLAAKPISTLPSAWQESVSQHWVELHTWPVKLHPWQTRRHLDSIRCTCLVSCKAFDRMFTFPGVLCAIICLCAFMMHCMQHDFGWAQSSVVANPCISTADIWLSFHLPTALHLETRSVHQTGNTTKVTSKNRSTAYTTCQVANGDGISRCRL